MGVNNNEVIRTKKKIVIGMFMLCLTVASEVTNILSKLVIEVF